MKATFKTAEEHQLTDIKNICRAIESDNLYFCASNDAKRAQALIPTDNGLYNYTYYFTHFGFCRASRVGSAICGLGYEPYSNLGRAAYNFWQTAVDEGLYTPTKQLTVSCDAHIIWI